MVEGERRACLVNLQTSEAFVLDESGALGQERVRYNVESGVWELLVEQWDWVGEFYGFEMTISDPEAEPGTERELNLETGVRFARSVELDGGPRIEFADPGRIALVFEEWIRYCEVVLNNPDASREERVLADATMDGWSAYLDAVNSELGTQEASIARFNQAFTPAFEAIWREFGGRIQGIRTEMGLDPSLEAFAEAGVTIALVNHNSAESPDVEAAGQALGFMATVEINGVERYFWFTIGADGGLVINISMNRTVRMASFPITRADVRSQESHFITTCLTQIFGHIQHSGFLTRPGQSPSELISDPDHMDISDEDDYAVLCPRLGPDLWMGPTVVVLP